MRRHIFAGWLLILIALSLAACSQESELAFYKEEQWLFESSFTFDPDAMPEIGLSAPIISGLSLDASTSIMNPALLETVFNQAVNFYCQQGLDVSWERREAWGGELTYALLAKGQGWQQLKAFLTGSGIQIPAELKMPTMLATSFDITNLGNEQIHFVAELPQDPLGLGLLVPTTFRLRGGRILSSNAHEVRGGEAIWHSPTGTIEATLTAARPLNQIVLLVVGGLGGVVIVGGSVFLTLRFIAGRRSASRMPGRSSSRPGRPIAPPRRSQRRVPNRRRGRK